MTARNLLKAAGSLLAVGWLSATLVAQTAAAARYDNQIQTGVTQKLAKKSQFNDVKSSVEDGIVTLTGTVISTSADWMRPSLLEKLRTCRAWII
jgi:osmotically-inducible protein OsmY